jgi:hypothetical protein
MARFDYGKMTSTASRLLKRFNQGSVRYIESAGDVGAAWDPIKGSDVYSTLAATVSGVSARYVDGKTVIATDLMVTAAVFDRVPTMSGRLEIDGKEVQIVKIMPKPAAGTVVVWNIICRA